MAKLFNYYSIDECNDRDRLFERLDSLQENGKIDYEMKDRDIFSIKDLELEDTEIDKLVKEFDNLEVYSYLDYEDYEEDDDFVDDYGDENEYEY